MTLNSIRQEIRNYGLSQLFNESGQLISVTKNPFDDRFDVIISEGGYTLRTSTVVAQYSGLDSVELIETLNLDCQRKPTVLRDHYKCLFF